MNEATLVEGPNVTQADREAAERFGSAWRMNAASKFGLSNLLARHRIAATSEAATRIEKLEAGLRAIAEGNLGDYAWQANYDRIRVLAASLLNNPPERGDHGN